MKHPIINFFLSGSPIIVGILVRLYMKYGAKKEYVQFTHYDLNAYLIPIPDLAFFCINLFLLSILTLDTIIKIDNINITLFKTQENTKKTLKAIKIISYIGFAIIVIILFAYNFIGKDHVFLPFHSWIIGFLLALAFLFYIFSNIFIKKINQ